MIFEPVLQRNGLTYCQKITLNHSNFKVMVDMGWDAALSLDLDPVIQALENVDLVLLTHATIKHLGAFSLLYKQVERLRRLPVYCTYPVMTLGKLLLTESYRSIGLAGPFTEPELSVAEIEESFNNVQLIKYSQPTNLAHHQLDGLFITGYNSGHTLGGTLWKLETAMDSCLVALDWNHSKDTHLNGGFLATGGKVSDQLTKPEVLITTCNISKGSLKKSKTELGDNITQTVQNGGSVLIPVSLARVLEFVLLLDSLGLKVPVLFVSSVSKKTLSQASSMLEWMVTSVINEWQVKNESPFSTSRIKCLETIGKLENYRDEAKVVLCTDESLELGLGREIFHGMASDSRNSLILTQTVHSGLAASLINLWSGKGLVPITGDISVTVAREVPLQGAALRQFNQKRKEQIKLQEAQEALEKRNQTILAAREEESSDEEQMEEHTTEQATGPAAFVLGNLHDYTVDGTEDCVFPYIANRTKTDDYGELIKPGQFQLDEDVEMEIAEEQPEAPRPAKKREPLPEPKTLVKTEKIVHMSCKFNYVDFNGLTDVRSLGMILTQVAPQTMLVLPGPALKAVQELKLESLVADIRIEVANQTQVLHLKLSHQLQASLQWQQVLGGRVAHVSGTIEADGDQQNILGMASTTKDERTFFVGEIKLTELKKKLAQNGYRAEFQRPGVLVCNDKVSVTKRDDGFYIIEGGLEDEFYQVRQAVKSFLAQV